MNKFKITNVVEKSIAYKAGIRSGDYLVSVNGNRIRDVFDYKYHIADEKVRITFEDSSGKIRNVDITKDQYEDIGLEFESFLMDKPRACNNKCIFCFIDQLPKGMRKSLYFKDDDVRLSYLHGNYVTLTNCSEEDISRIIRYRMSPVNVSVHTTNPQLRIMMLGNRKAGNILEVLQRFSNAGICINCQIVLCRGINDGAELDRTLNDLSSLYPGVRSISVVPVGLTRFREDKYPLIPYDKQFSIDVIKQVEKHQTRNKALHGSSIAFLADEFYIMAEYRIPEYDHYEDFPQIENGVGIVSMFMHEFYESLRRRRKKLEGCRKINLVTGFLASGIIGKLAKDLEDKYPGLEICVHVIKNKFFGEHVTVTGLITGTDIVSQLKGKLKGDILMIPDVMLKYGTHMFLDDYTVEMVEEQLGVKVIISGKSGRDFIDTVIGTR